MDLVLITALACLLGAVAVVVAAVLVLRGRGAGLDGLRDSSARLAAAQSEMSGRLSQLAETQLAAQTALNQRLQEQERALSGKLEERLAEVSRRVGESLEKSSQTTQTTITDLRERLTKIDEAQKNITELSSQVVGLQDILSNKQARGAFGEVQLQDLVTSVLPPSAFAFQAQLSTGTRADCLLRLPNPPGPIVVDAKFPLEAYNAMQAAQSDAERIAAERQFEKDVRRHLRDIAERYIVPGETADQALMFLPSEAIYAELHHPRFAGTIEESRRARVYIVSPNTCWALLTTIRAVLKDVRMREQASLIQAEVGKMLGDVQRLDDRVGKLESHFHQAQEDVRKIRISADKITKRGEQIENVQLGEGAGPDELLPDDGERPPVAGALPGGGEQAAE